MAPNDTNRRSADGVNPACIADVGTAGKTIWKTPRARTSPKAPGKTPVSCGVVTIDFNPGPDAQDRLRRLFTLLVKYATKDKLSPSDTDSPSKDDPAEDEA